MAHVVTENCNDCKYTDCVEVCPVDCFYELENQLVIDPDACIDCSICVYECPVEAIYYEDELPDNQERAIEINAEGAIRAIEEGKEPITVIKDPLPWAEEKRLNLGL